MNVYDRVGNKIEVNDYKGNSLNDAIYTARILEERSGKFRLQAWQFWGLWTGLVLSGFTSVLCFLSGIILWTWPPAIAGILFGLIGAFGSVGLADYYKHHGVPRKVEDKPKEMYCKSCQQKIEDELEVGKEHRVQELLAELEQLGVATPPALEAARDDTL